jgi:hypothetical protein
MNIQERFNYYIKNWKDKQTIKIPDNAKFFKQNELIYYTGPNTMAPKDFAFQYGCWKEMFWWHQDLFPLNIPCLSISADGIDNQELPAIVKVRYINNPKGGIIGPLEYGRHWTINDAINFKGLWNNKQSDCIWRGAPTGEQDYGEEPLNWKNTRMAFCYKWKDKFDIGITFTWDRWDSNYLKSSITIHEMLTYKYIISIPGKDKDSGINWKLASNSVVLMATPKIESWLMEGLLKPWVHYVPLADDYSDLDKIVEWCRNNDDRCQQIVRNANQFMKQFENIEVEKKIFNMIKQHYMNTFNFI